MNIEISGALFTLSSVLHGLNIYREFIYRYYDAYNDKQNDMSYV